VLCAGRMSDRHLNFRGRMHAPKEPHVVVTKERDVHTYAELWHASKCMLDSGKKHSEGAQWQFLSSMILTAFTFEAYLNHVGPTLFAHWNHLERLSPGAKFELVCEKLQVKFDLGTGGRPLQTVTKLLDFRNTMAHGRSLQIKAKPLIRTVDNYQGALGEQLLANWEKLIVDDTFAERSRVDVEVVIRAIHDARPQPKEAVFTFGLGSYGAKLVVAP
jgi:hypothetical protein